MPLLKVRNATNDGWIILGWGEDPGPDPGPAPSIADLRNEPFVTVAASSVLTAERVLTAGAGITVTDGGTTITIAATGGDADDAFAFFMGAAG